MLKNFSVKFEIFEWILIEVANVVPRGEREKIELRWRLKILTEMTAALADAHTPLPPFKADYSLQNKSPTQLYLAKAQN